jgi:ribulose-5-phosphate 4-epimerase/fuculose-1-phosphate aldolase
MQVLRQLEGSGDRGLSSECVRVPSDIYHAKYSMNLSDLIYCYKLAAKNEWEDSIFAHISARSENGFITARFGVPFSQVTVTDLISVPLDENTEMSRFGFNIHSAIYKARRDVNAIIHTHTIAGMAVAAQGYIKRFSQPAMIVASDLATHEYSGPIVSENQTKRLVADLADHRFMLLQHHGLLTVGTDIPEAYMSMHLMEQACKVQMAVGPHANEVIRKLPKIHAFREFTSVGLAWEASTREFE